MSKLPEIRIVTDSMGRARQMFVNGQEIPFMVSLDVEWEPSAVPKVHVSFAGNLHFEKDNSWDFKE